MKQFSNHNKSTTRAQSWVALVCHVLLNQIFKHHLPPECFATVLLLDYCNSIVFGIWISSRLRSLPVSVCVVYLI